MNHSNSMNTYHKRQSRVLAVVLVMCFLFVSMFAAGLAIVHAGHGCADVVCTVCPAIVSGQKILKSLTSVVVVAVIAMVLTLAAMFAITAKIDAQRTPVPSLFAIKTRLNN
ncbi:MAG: hypothetical protein FWG45_05465 [Oscillospiraceae bacterium]|nr:hypothetical protein [Oscillospiraceae bacterium]